MKHTEQFLHLQIETLVRKHIEYLQAEVTASVARAFMQVKAETIVRQDKPIRAVKKKNRTQEEFLKQAQRLHQEILAQPGATMIQLSARIGLSSAQLYGPMIQLKDAKKIHTVGKRQFTRYFPLSCEN